MINDKISRVSYLVSGNMCNFLIFFILSLFTFFFFSFFKWEELMIIPLRFRCYDRRLSPRHLIKWIDILEICPFVNLDNKSLNHGREEGKEEERRKKRNEKNFSFSFFFHLIDFYRRTRRRRILLYDMVVYYDDYYLIRAN